MKNEKCHKNQVNRLFTIRIGNFSAKHEIYVLEKAKHIVTAFLQLWHDCLCLFVGWRTVRSVSLKTTNCFIWIFNNSIRIWPFKIFAKSVFLRLNYILCLRIECVYLCAMTSIWLVFRFDFWFRVMSIWLLHSSIYIHEKFQPLTFDGTLSFLR